MSTGAGKFILAIDLGTSGPKVALVSVQGEVIAHETEPTGVRLLPGGGAEQDPDEWWQAIRTATRRLLEKRTVPVGEIVAISCASQFSCTVAVGRDGRPLMNAINWMDTRGARHVKAITGGWPSVEGYGIGKLLTWLRRTGGIPTHSGKDSIAHILYLKHERPEIYRDTHKFLEPKDYINSRLTGKFCASYDSIALHWLTDNRDISRIVYDDRLLALAGVDRDKLPDLKLAVDVLGPLSAEAARELGLSETVQVVVGTIDTESSGIGAGAVKDYEAYLYLGTSSWLTCHVPFKKTDLAHNMASLPAAIPGRYWVANEQECAGSCLTFLRDSLFHHADGSAEARPAEAYQRFDRLAEQAPPGSGRMIFAPWLVGERTPVEDHLLRGGFFNVSLRAAHEHFVRAVFEGVAYNSRWLFGHVEKFVGRRLEALNVVGGGAKSDIWCQIYADVLDRPIRQVQDPILASPRGAAFLAAVALGCMTFDDIPRHIRIARSYEPNPANRGLYDELFREFLNLYKSNRPIFARLNRAG